MTNARNMRSVIESTVLPIDIQQYVDKSIKAYILDGIEKKEVKAVIEPTINLTSKSLVKYLDDVDASKLIGNAIINENILKDIKNINQGVTLDAKVKINPILDNKDKEICFRICVDVNGVEVCYTKCAF